MILLNFVFFWGIAMKTKHLLPVIILMALALLLAVAGSLPELTGGETTVTVFIPAGEGYAVTGQNPVTVRPGEDASFEFAVCDGYIFRSISNGSFENGILTIHAPRYSCNIYPELGKYCTVSTEVLGYGSAELIGDAVVLDGGSASVQITPQEHYIAKQITVNGREYPVPTDGVLTFSVQDHTQVRVEFAGEALSLLAMSGNLGTVEIHSEEREYRYGDVLKLSSRCNTESIIFTGWSVGNYLQAGGSLLSADPQLEYRITENTVLYANFKDIATYKVSYDANGGQMHSDPQQESSPGEYIHTARDLGYFTREGFCLLEYNTEPDGSGQRYGLGSMLEMPCGDLKLYAQWAKETDASLLDYKSGADGVTLIGLSRAGEEAGLTELIVPKSIGGVPVTAIAPNSFCDMQNLQRIVIPLGVETLGGDAFSRCSVLKTVYLPESLLWVGDGVFAQCNSFTTLRILSDLDMVYDYDYDSALADKYMRLKNTSGKRIILVGGSNLCFGINSDLIARKYPDYTVVNFSCSMHYGILPLFDILAANVREGDVVIFSPEYSYGMYACIEMDTTYNWQYLESNYDILEDISMQNNPAIFRHFDLYLATKREFLPGKVTGGNNIYSRNAFNAAGDLIEPRPGGKVAAFKMPDMDILQNEGMNRYNRLCRQLSERGARCFFSFPPNPIGSYAKEYVAAETKVFEQKLSDMLDNRYCVVISQMMDYCFPTEYFYDSTYHMTLEGAVVRTEQLLADLAPYMERQA